MSSSAPKPPAATDTMTTKTTTATMPYSPEEVIQGLRVGLAAAGLSAKVISSFGADVDIVPASAGKGRALDFLLSHLEARGVVERSRVQVR